MTGDQTWSNWTDPADDPRPPAPPTTQLPLSADRLLDIREFAVAVAFEHLGAKPVTTDDVLRAAHDIAEFVQHGTVPDEPDLSGSALPTTTGKSRFRLPLP